MRTFWNFSLTKLYRMILCSDIMLSCMLRSVVKHLGIDQTAMKEFAETWGIYSSFIFYYLPTGICRRSNLLVVHKFPGELRSLLLGPTVHKKMAHV
ncbi:hypothetical protein A4A49_21229 [Nicotiana attenuata]|uniref:Uncharacterized protein n=1 Tax=Nicotiana attenuata TaxID=49451 RepID=A0A1J6KC24_NICAT|nr:hypothetical protein A4A49_21229 [Nicotiana attenuata]